MISFTGRAGRTRKDPQPKGFAERLSYPWLWPSMLTLVVLAGVLAIAPRAPGQETARAKALGQKLMCACGCNQILTACNHVGCKYSYGMLQELDARIARGDSDDLILQSFVQEYGGTVLAEPPTKGFNLAAWVVPIVVPLGALILVWQLVRRWKLRASLALASGPALPLEFIRRAQEHASRELDE